MLIDQYQRRISYLRLSVTDRCDFRCQYCMSEDIEFMPKQQMLTIEEMTRLSQIFINLGITKIRLTGGEPLVRRGIDDLIISLGKNKKLKELTLTTNGSQLDKKYSILKKSGIKRINVSLDSLNAKNFKAITRGGDLNQVLSNLELIKNNIQVKLNVVLMKNINDHEINDLLNYAIERHFNITFIEQMPLGDIGFDRYNSFIDSDKTKELIESNFSLIKIPLSTGGPADYWKIKNTDTAVGFISPHTHNFCEACNRIRVSADGHLHLCLGQENKINLIDPLRAFQSDYEVEKVILEAMLAKPKSHDFDLQSKTQIIRFMSHTGG
ncbi:MAG: GTP 3',8-cyclase MoaA [Methylophilaceae bacterium]|jgi:GTP 3',8-cyclase